MPFFSRHETMDPEIPSAAPSSVFVTLTSLKSGLFEPSNHDART
jgi:hypothetical protein